MFVPIWHLQALPNSDYFEFSVWKSSAHINDEVFRLKSNESDSWLLSSQEKFTLSQIPRVSQAVVFTGPPLRGTSFFSSLSFHQGCHLWGTLALGNSI